jgi:hypothetical protein
MPIAYVIEGMPTIELTVRLEVAFPPLARFTELGLNVRVVLLCQTRARKCHWLLNPAIEAIVTVEVADSPGKIVHGENAVAEIPKSVPVPTNGTN